MAWSDVSGLPTAAWPVPPIWRWACVKTGRRYIIGAPKSELKKFGAELACPDGWRTVQHGVEVKLARHPETGETAILCRSADRRSKEKAMHDKFSGSHRRGAPNAWPRASLVQRNALDPAPVNRQIGRILQQNQRAAARFAILQEPILCPAGLRLSVTCNDAFDDWAALWEGAYLPALTMSAGHGECKQ